MGGEGGLVRDLLRHRDELRPCALPCLLVLGPERGRVPRTQPLLDDRVRLPRGARQQPTHTGSIGGVEAGTPHLTRLLLGEPQRLGSALALDEDVGCRVLDQAVKRSAERQLHAVLVLLLLHLLKLLAHAGLHGSLGPLALRLIAAHVQADGAGQRVHAVQLCEVLRDAGAECRHRVDPRPLGLYLFWSVRRVRAERNGGGQQVQVLGQQLAEDARCGLADARFHPVAVVRWQRLQHARLRGCSEEVAVALRGLVDHDVGQVLPVAGRVAPLGQHEGICE